MATMDDMYYVIAKQTKRRDADGNCLYGVSDVRVISEQELKEQDSKLEQSGWYRVAGPLPRAEAQVQKKRYAAYWLTTSFG